MQSAARWDLDPALAFCQRRSMTQISLLIRDGYE